MYEILKTAHSFIAYIAIAALLLAAINAIVGVSSKKLFTSKDLRISLFAMILAHMQLLLGMLLYFVSERGFKAFQISGAMKNPELRLTMLEHPLINIIALVLITIGWSKHKKEESNNGKFKKIALFYSIGVLLILSRIPWSNWM